MTRKRNATCQSFHQTTLTHRAYLGFVKHGDEWFDGNFEPIVTPALFEAVQKGIANVKKVPRKGKSSMIFLSLDFRCGECGSMISAQWATGKIGSSLSLLSLLEKARSLFTTIYSETELAPANKKHGFKQSRFATDIPTGCWRK